MDAAKLRIVGGTRQGEELALDLPATIGRGRDNSITLSESLVSRRHCRISQQGDDLVVADLDSLNGTYIGSERISGNAILKPGTLLTIGTVTLRAIYGEYAESEERDKAGSDSKVIISDDDVLSEDTVNLGEGGTVIDPEKETHSVPAPKSRPLCEAEDRTQAANG